MTIEASESNDDTTTISGSENCGGDDDLNEALNKIENEVKEIENMNAGWEELMGKDLLLKSLQRPSHDTGEDVVWVQSQDAVIVDFVGRVLLPPPDRGGGSADTAATTTITSTTTAAATAAAATAENAIGPIFHRAQDWLLVVGEKDVVPALEMGIRFMQQGETAAIRSHSKYAHGPGTRVWKNNGDCDSSCHNNNNAVVVDKNGDDDDDTNHHQPSAQPQQQQQCCHNYTLPAHAAVEYTVTLKRVVPSAELTQRSFQLRLCQSKKRIANDMFNNDDILHDPYAKSRALYVYQRAADMLDYMLQQQQEQQKEDGASDKNENIDGDDNKNNNNSRNENDSFDREAARECLLDCLNNIAAVHLRCKSYHAAKQACVTVLEKDGTNIKALLRAAKAALLDPASSYQEVDAAIAAAAEQCNSYNCCSDDDNETAAGFVKEVERLRANSQRRQLAHQKKEREMYSKMAKAAVVPTTIATTPSAAAAATTTEETINQDDADVTTERASKVDNAVVGANMNDNDVGMNKGDNDDDNKDQQMDASKEVPDADVNDTLLHPVMAFLQTLPWRSVIFPYGFQLLMPFVMYYCFKVMRRNSGQDDDNNFTTAAIMTQKQRNEL